MAASLNGIPGVAKTVALTSAGAIAAPVECLLLSGHGKLILTGNLVGEARDSAQVALSLARSRARTFGIDPADFLRTDVHIHIPGGGVARKGGPSAGLAMFVALVSAMIRKPVDPRMAFTGELSLTGEVLAVDGISKKARAAVAAGMTHLLIPHGNSLGTRGLTGKSAENLKIALVKTVDEALEISGMKK
ncbi:MAG TPA: hypothetical protein DCQ83_08430 [Fibrobacteres bacterium]|jgi:ATP-dependent Lon protease|nr:hypothetical protein [Fibrobacterota bacterium]